MKLLRHLRDEVWARVITLVSDADGVKSFKSNGWGYRYTIYQACSTYGDREVLGIYDQGDGEVIIEIA